MAVPSNSVGVAYGKEAAKALRKEVAKLTGRKGHYLKMPNSTEYWVWVDKATVEAKPKITGVKQ